MNLKFNRKKKLKNKIELIIVQFIENDKKQKQKKKCIFSQNKNRNSL